ncbi:MAG: pyruvate kinase [Lachnospiraceae bacterium]|nr:pyruvate kinase [Lachnospiraceae bacterium]
MKTTKRTKIVCTMGPNTDNKEILKGLALEGMDIARMNFSHGDHEEQKHRMDLVKEVREEIDRPIAILLDTKGPEIRTGVLKEESVILEEGQKFILTADDVEGDANRVSITYKDLIHDVEPGNTILIDDGLLGLTVEEVDGNDIVCRVENGGKLSSRKGVNVPNVQVNLPAITEKDREDIIFGIKQGIDFIAASFVRNASAVNEIRAILRDYQAEDIGIISKIENEEGVINIDEIIAVSDGIMVARGDLGVEIPEEEVPFIQKRLIKKCNDAFKPVITATQMLDSMIRNPRPTRAEVTDVANAIYDGTDAIMLSGETAMGKYPVEAVKTMANIAAATETHLDYNAIMEYKKAYRHRGVSSAVSYSAVTTAMNLNAKCIIASTVSGFTARIVSKFKPDCTIVGLSPNDKAIRRMQIYWGVVPYKTTQANTTDELLELGVGKVKEKGLAREGDIVVLTGGGPSSLASRGITDLIKVETVE